MLNTVLIMNVMDNGNIDYESHGLQWEYNGSIMGI